MRERWLDPAYRNKTVSAIRSSARSRTPRAEHPEASGATETDGLALLLDDDDAPPGAAAWRSPRAAGARRGGSMRSRATPAKLGAHGLATASVDEALRRSARSHRNAAAIAAAAKRAAARDQEDDDSPDGSDDSGADAEEDAEIQSAASRRRMRVTRAAAAAAAGLSLPDGGVDGHLDGLHAYGGGGLGPAVSGGGPMGEMPSSAPSTGLGAKAGDMLLSAPRRRGRPKGSGAGARQQQSAAQAAAAQLQLAAALRHSLAELEIEPLHTQLFPQVSARARAIASARPRAVLTAPPHSRAALRTACAGVRRGVRLCAGAARHARQRSRVVRAARGRAGRGRRARRAMRRGARRGLRGRRETMLSFRAEAGRSAREIAAVLLPRTIDDTL